MSRRIRFPRDFSKKRSHRLRLKPPKDFSCRIHRRNNSKEEIAQAYDHQGCLLEAAERKIIALQDTIQDLLGRGSQVEYIRALYTGGVDHTRWLNSFGALGWRLCSVPTGNEVNHIFCRVKPKTREVKNGTTKLAKTAAQKGKPREGKARKAR